MSNLKEVVSAINILTKNGTKKKNISVLHCHSDYPTELKDVNLLAMKHIEKKNENQYRLFRSYNGK